MSLYGLTEEEKKTNLHSYNHAMFRNMMFFMDMIWEINLQTGTAYVLEDRWNPEKVSTEFVYEDYIRESIKNRIRADEQEKLFRIMDNIKLSQMKDEISVDVHLLTEGNTWELHRFVLTPAFAESGEISHVYFGGKNLYAEAREEREALWQTCSKELRESGELLDFLAKLSYDVKGKLNEILGLIPLTEHSAEEPEQVKEYLEKIRETGQELMELMDGTMDISLKTENAEKDNSRRENVRGEGSRLGMENIIKFTMNPVERRLFRGRRVMLVEDNELNASMAMELFSTLGLETKWACNGQEAVELIQKAEDGYYDVIFMDMQMPVMDGYEATRRIRAMDREYTERLPIFALTAFISYEDIKMAKKVGMNDYFTKPIDINRLKIMLQKYLTKR